MIETLNFFARNDRPIMDSIINDNSTFQQVQELENENFTPNLIEIE